MRRPGSVLSPPFLTSKIFERSAYFGQQVPLMPALHCCASPSAGFQGARYTPRATQRNGRCGPPFRGGELPARGAHRREEGEGRNQERGGQVCDHQVRRRAAARWVTPCRGPHLCLPVRGRVQGGNTQPPLNPRPAPLRARPGSLPLPTAAARAPTIPAAHPVPPRVCLPACLPACCLQRALSAGWTPTTSTLWSGRARLSCSR